MAFSSIYYWTGPSYIIYLFLYKFILLIKKKWKFIIWWVFFTLMNVSHHEKNSLLWQNFLVRRTKSSYYANSLHSRLLIGGIKNSSLMKMSGWQMNSLLWKKLKISLLQCNWIILKMITEMKINYIHHLQWEFMTGVYFWRMKIFYFD